MIQAITKEFFKSKVGHPEFKIVDLSLENSAVEKGVDFSTGYMPLYFMIPGYGFFVNLYGISKVAIPVTNEKEIDLDSQVMKGTIDWSNWEIKKTELVKYSENEFNRLETRAIDLSGIPGWIEREEGKLSSWMLTNRVTGEEIRFTTKYHNSSWNGEQIRIAFEELLQVPCKLNACKERAGFIQNLITKHWNELIWIK